MKKKWKVKKSWISSMKWILAIILIIMSLFILVVSIGTKKQEELTTVEEKGYLDYQVYLKSNQYYQVPYLKKGERYISALIDAISVQFEYELDSKEALNYDGKYRIDASLDVKQKNDTKDSKTLWAKQFVIQPTKQTKLQKKNKITVKDEFVIDYDIYTNLVRTFQQQYQVDVRANLDVKIYIDTVGTLENKDKDITKNVVMSLQIPLNETTIDITEENNLIRGKEVILDESDEMIHNKPLFILGCFLLSASTIVFVYYGLELLKDGKEQYSYSKEKNRILRKYDSVIVNAKRIPNMEGLSIIEVSSFDELLDAEEELHTPIIFVEMIPGAVGWFFIITQNQVWRYVLKVKVK